MTSDIYGALENVIALGCKRVLTSGGENTALEGAPCIAKMVEQADGRITIMPGKQSSLEELLQFKIISWETQTIN